MGKSDPVRKDAAGTTPSRVFRRSVTGGNARTESGAFATGWPNGFFAIAPECFSAQLERRISFGFT
jgi:hypothetical protein